MWLNLRGCFGAKRGNVVWWSFVKLAILFRKCRLGVWSFNFLFGWKDIKFFNSPNMDSFQCYVFSIKKMKNANKTSLTSFIECFRRFIKTTCKRHETT